MRRRSCHEEFRCVVKHRSKRLRGRKACLFVVLTKFFSVFMCNNCVSTLSSPLLHLCVYRSCLIFSGSSSSFPCVWLLCLCTALLFVFFRCVSSTTQEERETAAPYKKGSKTTPLQCWRSRNAKVHRQDDVFHEVAGRA